MADITPDFAPIMGMTPIKGFYLDAGWGTWGFKATPISGKTMAHTLANDKSHDLIHSFRLSRFEDYELTGEKILLLLATRLFQNKSITILEAIEKDETS